MTERVKTEATEKIKAIKIGNKDALGYLITDVLAVGNEYAVYEIETEDINKKLRVYIDGLDDESEQKILKDYIEVKQLYIQAKGLLYRSSNFGMMKNRVAHALSTALSGNAELAASEFKGLIGEINKEYKRTFVGRIYYVVPGYVLMLFLLCLSVFQTCYGWPTICQEVKEWLDVALAASIGGAFSLTLNVKNMVFAQEITEGVYIAYGLERISIALLAGVICTLGIKSEFIFANLIGESPEEVWGLLFVVSVAAFSEKMVPNLMKNIDAKAQKV
ncbi:MAG: hypothetical protein OET90_02420 [Desulfuromonadales bacterium]|nr:hypothetical protein [Desulfuromonadales bacterium]